MTMILPTQYQSLPNLISTAHCQRVILIVLDSVGCGALPDAVSYGDEGSDTLGNTSRAVGGLHLPCLGSLGLGNIVPLQGVPPVERPRASWGKMAERSAGKDTTIGHWEMMGLVVEEPLSTFPQGFPEEIVTAFVRATGRDVLWNLPASGTEIIRRLGEEHVRTGKWILYTSADSVFQVAAHEEVVPVEELYAACQWARKLLDPYRVGRVIARPFVGECGSYSRTYNRRDYSIEPFEETVLDRLAASDVPVIGIGKIHDIFAGRAITRSIHTDGNRDGICKTSEAMKSETRGLIFVNLVDYDMLYGHRRDPKGYAAALEEFDAHLPDLIEMLDQGDLLIITADHGCDPTLSRHTDHTREYVPLLILNPEEAVGKDLGVRQTFADVGALVEEAFSLTTSQETSVPGM